MVSIADKEKRQCLQSGRFYHFISDILELVMHYDYYFTIINLLATDFVLLLDGILHDLHALCPKLNISIIIS